MRKPVILLTVAMVLLGLVWLAMDAARPKEPTHAGRTLSAWLTERNSAHPRDLSDSTQEAIQAMGTNALAHLLRTISRKDSAAKLRLRGWLSREAPLQRSIRRWTATHQSERLRAAAGFKALGNEGAPAVPALIRLLGDEQTSYPAALALAGIGRPAIPGLVQSLTNQSVWVRSSAVQAINFMHGADGAEEAIPDLLERLNDPHPAVRGGASIALGDMRMKPQLVIPKLMERLGDADASVRASAARAIGLFQEQGTAAVPRLEELQSDPSPEVRQWASTALRQILPESDAP
jgi:HEAT repeat protein